MSIDKNIHVATQLAFDPASGNPGRGTTYSVTTSSQSTSAEPLSSGYQFEFTSTQDTLLKFFPDGSSETVSANNFDEVILGGQSKTFTNRSGKALNIAYIGTVASGSLYVVKREKVQ